MDTQRRQIGWGSADRILWLLGAAGAVFLYTRNYLTISVRPSGQHLGWWAWWDQSQYLASAKALAHLDFSPAHNLYPLAYSLLAAPFTYIFPQQPFVLVDLAGLLGAYAGFLVVARSLQVGLIFAIPIFLLTIFTDPWVAAVWVEPWNTTLSAALIWGALATAAVILQRPANLPPRLRTILLLGVLTGALPLARPTDALLSAIILAWTGTILAHRGWLRPRLAATLLLGAVIVVAPYALLHLRIYGPHPSYYELAESGAGFTPSWIGWKLYEIIIASRPWYPGGVSMLQRFPWLLLSFAGLLLLMFRSARSRQGVPPEPPLRGLLAACIIATWLIFIAYIDTLPTSLWRYNNIHYFKWTFPGLGLFAFWLGQNLIRKNTRLAAAAALALVTLVSAIRLVPVPAQASQLAAMVQLPGPQLAWENIYLKSWQVTDVNGLIARPLSVRVIPDSQGVRLLPQRHEFDGQVVWVNQPDRQVAPEIRWAATIRLGYPCWLPPYPCDQLRPGS